MADVDNYDPDVLLRMQDRMERAREIIFDKLGEMHRESRSGVLRLTIKVDHGKMAAIYTGVEENW